MPSVLELQAAELELSAMGQRGGVILTGTTAITGKYRIIYALADATFTTLTSEFTKNGIVTLAVGADFGTLSKGVQLVGKFTAITLATGTVIAYE